MEESLTEFGRDHEARLRALGPDAGIEAPISRSPLATMSGTIPDDVLAFMDFDGTVFRHADASRALIWNSRFRGVAYSSSFFKAKMHNSSLTGFTFIDCMLARADFDRSDLDAVVFHRCSLLKTRFTGARMHNVHFVSCTFDGTFFDGAHFDHVYITDPIIEGQCFTDGATGDLTALDTLR